MGAMCARCGAVLPPMEGEAAGYCWQCGLPQLRVSEPVLEAAEARSSAAAAPGSAAGLLSSTAGMSPSAVDWPIMLRVLLVATAVGLLPCVLLRDALFEGAVGVSVLFLLPVLCLASGFAYVRQRPLRRMSAGAGARMGLALGTMLAFAVTTVTAIAVFARRYGRHNTALQQTLDGMMQQAVAQVRATQPSAPDGFLRAMQLPEWHAGWFLTIEGGMMLLLIVGGCLAGMVAGMLLRARQTTT